MKKRKKTRTSQVEDSEEILEECLECGHPYPVDELVDGLCPDCREMMEAEMDLEDEEMFTDGGQD